MIDLGLAYPWVKALHIISVIAWMAGLLYLPRLFVYHTQVKAGSEASETFKIMERRLLKAIMTPAAVAAWIFGLLLFLNLGSLAAGWIHAKLLLVVLLTASHVLMARWKNDFAADANRRPTRFYRMVNEVPTLLMLAIVILAVVKPF